MVKLYFKKILKNGAFITFELETIADEYPQTTAWLSQNRKVILSLGKSDGDKISLTFVSLEGKNKGEKEVVEFKYPA
jgi:hypothetical protein